MAKGKKSTSFVDSRTPEEKELTDLRIKIQHGNFSETDKIHLEELVVKLNANGIAHEFNGIGKYYAVVFDGDDEINKFKLVASNPITIRDEEGFIEVSLDAPMGNAVTKMNVGDVSGYKVRDNLIVITLLEVADSKEELISKLSAKEKGTAKLTITIPYSKASSFSTGASRTATLKMEYYQASKYGMKYTSN